MSQHPTTLVLFNPAAGRGRGRRRIDDYMALLGRHLPPFDYVESERPGHEVAIVDQAIADGYTSLIAIGGDGTWSIVADRIVRSGAPVTLGLLPAGTGNDFGKSLGIRYEDRDAVVHAIANGHHRTVDVGRAGDRHFLNVVGVGFDIAVIDDADGFPILKGDALYQFCALRQLFRFGGMPIAVSDGGTAPPPEDHLMLVIANGNYFGGSFHIAPRASLEDGRLDAVSILNAGPLARARLFSRVAKGRHEGDSRVRIRNSDRFVIDFGQVVRYELDGEVYTSAGPSLEVVSVPQALRVYVPPS